MEDFDIYGDLEHIESEAKKESLELRALQCRIKELQEIVNAAEQEKQDIIKKNDILLENVSSLLLTAKAELKRKDTVISDLRKQCDNVVFRRGNQADTRIKCVTKFTQTPVRHVVHTAIQTVPAEENDPFWRKSRHDVDMELDRYREHDRERERDGKNVKDHKRIRDRDKADDRERVRQRDEERNRDRERNRDQYRSQHRTQYRDQNRRSEYPSYERSRDREVHSSSQRKDSKSSKDRPLKQDRNEAHSSGHTSSNEADQLKNQNRRTFDKKAERLLTNSQTPCLQQDGKNDNYLFISKRFKDGR
uniref:Uncharacterized protein n=1 Tax=Anopheles christyi TaxID=43041 RepID=A0A182K9G3_9DIPT